MKRTLMALAALFAVFATALPAVAAPASHLYGVVFEVIFDAEGKVTSVKVNAVTDPLSRTPTKPLKMKLSEAFVARETARIFTQRGTQPGTFFMAQFYDPSQWPDAPDAP